VADTLAMVLGKEFRVVKSSRPERTRELLAKEVFDGLVTELESRNGGGGIELARYARELRPGIRPFFTTVQRPPYGLPAGAADPEVVMLEKPFDVEVLTRKVRARLLEA
jgi:DNA-binding NtrC family response regulator